MARAHSITMAQRQQLRRYAQKTSPKPSQKECIEWFDRQFGIRITQSAVSKILSARFEALDHDNTDKSAKRRREVQWPELDAYLIGWQQAVERQGGVTSDHLIRTEALRIWSEIPAYKDQPIPSFSNSWLQKFKTSHGIRRVQLHGEAGSVNLNAESEMNTVRALAAQFEPRNIYNMDETGLFWKMMPSTGLSSSNRPGLKRDKTRITVVCCCNATGDDRVPLWLIGKAAVPRALRSVNLHALNVHWRHNKKAWMTGTIMVEWLKAFYRHVGTERKVLLFWDNFSGHSTGLEDAPAPPNITICNLPANSTSIYQPMDQGIIQSLKMHYRRRWLEYMIESFKSQHNPLETHDLRAAIHWLIDSWTVQIENKTIHNCFKKSTIISGLAEDIPNINEQLLPLYYSVRSAGDISGAMSLENFLNPAEESVGTRQSDSLDDIRADLIQKHFGVQHSGEPEEPEDDVVAEPDATDDDALRSVKMLIRWAEQQPSIQNPQIVWMKRLQREISSQRALRIQEQRKQVSITSYFQED
jgi:DDE superfamily endonuclease/Fission yeast centromere protein N-terminal domain/Tc5 transposase DNA-binding domain